MRRSSEDAPTIGVANAQGSISLASATMPALATLIILGELVLHSLIDGLFRRTMTGLAAFLILAGPAIAGPTPEEYVEYVGEGAKIVPSGKLKLGGYKVRCGHRPTVIDNKLDDYGAAYPGFLILNKKLLAKVSTPVKLWIYSHECAHQFRGPDEEVADCFAVQRGRRRKWLTPEGLDQVCKFIAPATGDSMHFSGSQRCAKMRQCYNTKKVY